VGVPVVIDLIPGPAFRLNDGSEVLPLVETETDPTGTWSVPLEQSTNIDPSGSYYRCREMVPKIKGGLRTWFFLSPTVSPSKLHDCLTIPTIANSLIRPVVVQSTARPVNPYIGMQIFEADTGRVLYYYGSTVGWQPDWGLAWGEILGLSDTTGDYTTSSTSYVQPTGFQIAGINAIAGRQYVTVLSASMQLATTATNLFVGIYDLAGNQLMERQITLGSVPVTVPIEMYYREGALAGVTNRAARISVGVGTAAGTMQRASNHPAVISFRDVGPRAAPVITP